MTHWMVRVGKALGMVKDSITVYYLNDKRNFVETLVSVSGSILFVWLMVNWLILPFPEIPKSSFTSLGSNPSVIAILNVQKPIFLHIFALFGVMFGFTAWMYYIRSITHFINAIIIKGMNYYRFIKRSKEKIMQ